MLITSSHNAIPVNTANIPAEAIKNDGAVRPHIPKPPATAENPSSKHSTEFSEQNKAFINTLSLTSDDEVVKEKEQSGESSKGSSEQNSEEKTNDSEELDLEQLKQIQQLQSRDREVRAHEQAHAAVGGSLAGSPNLSYTTGPNGKRYAVSGEVSISVSSVPNDPAATIKKLEQVQRAALAPASPSSQDLKVAAQAAANVGEARIALTEQKLEEVKASQEKSVAAKEEINSEDKVQGLKAENTDSSVSSTEKEIFINPVLARRQAAQLNQKIASSGALDDTENELKLSLSA